MKVLLCGGARTRNIADTIQPRFKKGSVEIIVEDKIEGIEALLTRGEYFDRAVMIEQGWTDDGVDLEEFNIRQKVSDFIYILKNKSSRETNCVFVASSEDMAQIVAEESIEISNQCRVLLNTSGKYSAAFCIDLVIKNLADFSERLVFNLEKKIRYDYDQEEPIIYSQPRSDIPQDAEEELQKVPEIQFDGVESIEEEPEQLEIDSDGVQILDFDSEFDESTNNLGTIEFDKLGNDFGEEIELTVEEPEIPIEQEEIHDNWDTELEEVDQDIEEEPELDLGDLEIGDIYESGGVEETGVIEEDESESWSDDDSELNIEPEDCESSEEIQTEESDTELIIEDTELFDDVTEELVSTDEEPIETDEEPISIEDELQFDEDTQDKVLQGLFGDDEELIQDDDNEQEDIVEETESELEIDEEEPNDKERQDIADSLFNSYDKEKSENYEDEANSIEDSIPNITEQQIQVPDKEKSKLFGKKRSKEAKAITEKKNTFDTDIARLTTMLNTYKNRGGSLVVTGTPCSGTSTIAFNLANVISNLGYSVLIVDMDTVNRTQAFMSKEAYECIHSLDPENASLKQALNAVNNGIGRYVNIVKPGLHILTMGLAGDIVTGEKLAPKQKLARFSSNVRNNYNFVIYDIPFNVAIDYAADITFTADNIVLSCEASNHGIMAMMLAMCNIESEDMQEAMFNRSQICMTKFTTLNRVLDSRVTNVRDMLTRLDREVNNLLGIDPEYYFSNLGICGIMTYNTAYEDGWFASTQYSDSSTGKEEFIKLLSNILLKK